MLRVRRSRERGHFDHGWLDTFHTFSFDRYFDPDHVQFRVLRVLNEDRVAPGHGFPRHPHRDMEILTWVLEGELEHQDDLGNRSVIRPGEAQRMSAGTGVVHSEWNHSPERPVHLLQIWILPRHQGGRPSYEQRSFPAEERRNRLRRIVAADGAEGAVQLNQDVVVYTSLLESGRALVAALDPGRHGWLQVARGALELNDTALEAGDGVAILGEAELRIGATADCELLLFDLP